MTHTVTTWSMYLGQSIQNLPTQNQCKLHSAVKHPHRGATCISRRVWVNGRFIIQQVEFSENKTSKKIWFKEDSKNTYLFLHPIWWHVPISLCLNNSAESCRLRQLSEYNNTKLRKHGLGAFYTIRIFDAIIHQYSPQVANLIVPHG